MKKNDAFILCIRLLIPAMLLVLGADLYVRHSEERVVASPQPALTQEFVRTAHQVRGELAKAMELLEECFGHPVDLTTVRSVPVTLTAYTSTVEQCDPQPYVTASMHGVRAGVIAVSRDLEEMGLKFGKRVLIPGYGIFEVQDRMNKRWKNRVDIWHEDIQVARRFGKQSATLLWLEEPILTASTE